MFIILIHSFSFLTISFLTIVLNSSPVISVRKARKSTIRINILDEAVSAPRDDEGWRMLTTYDSAICPSLMMGFFFYYFVLVFAFSCVRFRSQSANNHSVVFMLNKSEASVASYIFI